MSHILSPFVKGFFFVLWDVASAVVTAQLLAFLMRHSHTEIQDLTRTFAQLYYMKKAASNYLGTNESFIKRRQKVRRVLGNVKKKPREHLIVSSLAYPSLRECRAFASFSLALNLLHFMLMTFLSDTLHVPIKVRGPWPQFKK